MTIILFSHNPQLGKNFEILSSSVLAKELNAHLTSELQVSEINHPHWKITAKSSLAPHEFVCKILDAWLCFRKAKSFDNKYTLLALGGRKDTPALSPDAPLQKGSWGVDIVETYNTDEFLRSIDWSSLKSGKSEESILEISKKIV